MRYCSRCGNALSVGASFCHSCGASLKALVPETDETPVAVPAAEPVVETVFEEPAAEPVVEPIAEEPAAEPVTEEPVVIPVNCDQDVRDEKAFLDQTHRLLRWERKAWSIAGKVYLISGIVIAALCFLMGIMVLAVSEGDEVGVAVGIIMLFMYGLIFGGMFIAVGVINIITAGKIPQYTDTLYKDFRAAHKRCNSIGMIVFGYFFNTIALVFYIINFVRMKCNKAVCKRILTRQGFPS